MNQYKIFFPLAILILSNVAIVMTAMIIANYNPEELINYSNLSTALYWFATANLLAVSSIAISFDTLIKFKVEDEK